MIYSGTDLKFKVEATIAGFSMADNDFLIVIKNRWGQTRQTIKKEECFNDEQGGFYFTVESVTTGAYFAFFTAFIPDDDYDKLTRNVVDKKHLYTVDSCGCNVIQTDCECPPDCECHQGTLKVKYTQVWTVNLDDGTYLTDKDGNLIIVDGNRVQLKV